MNITDNINNINNINNIKNGEKIMKNTIKENRAAEAAAKEAAAKEAERAARLAAIKPVNVVETMDEVINNIARAVRDENGNTMGTNGGELYQFPVYNDDGSVTTIAAESPEALEALKKDIAKGRQGDGKFHKLLIFDGGCFCDCVGVTLEKLQEDIIRAENYYQAHIKGSVIFDIDEAEQHVAAGDKKEDLEVVEGKDGNTYILCYNGNRIETRSGETIANLDNIKSILCRDDVKTLLIEKLNVYIDEQEAFIAECESEDYYSDDYDEINW